MFHTRSPAGRCVLLLVSALLLGCQTAVLVGGLIQRQYILLLHFARFACWPSDAESRDCAPNEILIETRVTYHVSFDKQSSVFLSWLVSFGKLRVLTQGDGILYSSTGSPMCLDMRGQAAGNASRCAGMPPGMRNAWPPKNQSAQCMAQFHGWRHG